MKLKILDQLDIEENHELECKLAEKGLPHSIWETYSAFANTEGGTILLGVKEHRESFEIIGFTDKQIIKLQKDFWSVIHDKKKVSNNILLNHHVSVCTIEDKKILKIDIPAADRHDKPVYIGTDPMEGTYRRNYEGDFLCTSEEVRAMYADQSDTSADSRVLKELDLDAFNTETVKSYRIRFQNLHTMHPWNKLQTDEFLLKLTALKKDGDGNLHPTLAGLLMFGDADRIVEILPNYFLDYREESNEKGIRWMFRTTSEEGDWSGNIFDFFFKVINRIDDDIAVPFVNRKGDERLDEVAVHEALHEVMANALAHADYYGRQGIVIIKNRKEISVSNPGTLRISREDFFAGGNSDPRNPLILKMFNRINIGERAGSGVDKILAAWNEQNWKTPNFHITLRPARLTVTLEVGQVTFVPGVMDLVIPYEIDDEKNISNKTASQKKEDLIIEYIKREGDIKMETVARLCEYKSRTSARNLMKKMMVQNQIKQVGSGKNTKYTLK